MATPSYQINQTVLSRVWHRIGQNGNLVYPTLRILSISEGAWNGEKVFEYEVTDGLQTNHVFEDTIFTDDRPDYCDNCGVECDGNLCSDCYEAALIEQEIRKNR